MSGKHILVIDPAIKTPELDCYNQMVLASTTPLTYHLPALHGLYSMEAVADSALGIIILGSATSVHDDLPWQKQLFEWLSPRLQSGLPTMGICYGHQAIAHLLGGKVEFLAEDKKKELGFRDVDLEADRLWGGPIKGELFVAHRETVTSLPPGMKILGRSSLVPLEVLAHSKLPIWTFQPHPEATPIFVKHVGNGEYPTKRFSLGHRLVKHFLDFVARGGR